MNLKNLESGKDSRGKQDNPHLKNATFVNLLWFSSRQSHVTAVPGSVAWIWKKQFLLSPLASSECFLFPPYTLQPCRGTPDIHTWSLTTPVWRQHWASLPHSPSSSSSSCTHPRVMQPSLQQNVWVGHLSFPATRSHLQNLKLLIILLKYHIRWRSSLGKMFFLFQEEVFSGWNGYKVLALKACLSQL